MEVGVRRERIPGINHSPRVMARRRNNLNLRRGPIATITLRHIIPTPKPRTTIILNTLRNTLEKLKEARIGTKPPIRIKSREMKGIIPFVSARTKVDQQEHR